MIAHAIQRTRLSFIWTRTFFDFFDGQNVKNLPFGFFATTSGYKEKYDELRNVVVDANGLSLPWNINESGKNYFWAHYLQGKQRQDLALNDAWDTYKIPFRKQVETQHESPTVLLIRAEGFFYRHGVAVLITIDLGECGSLDKWTAQALQVRRGKFFTTGGEEKKNSLQEIADNISDALCKSALGENKTKGLEFDGDPFSLVTVIDGVEDYIKEPLEQGGEIHKSLEKLATWNDLWPSGENPKLEEKRFSNVKYKIENHCIYAGRHGRVIWFPHRFSLQPGKRHSLGCYHRNLTLASLQTASLGAFISHAANESKKGNPLSQYLKNWARSAIGILDDFNTGEKTYRTWSTKDQIEKNGILDSMAYLKTVL